MHQNVPINSFLEFLMGWDFTGVQSTIFIIYLIVFVIGSIKFYPKSKNKSYYFKKIFNGLLGCSIMGIALSGPLDYYSSEIFSAHMLQHIFIAMVAIPILLISNPMPIILWAFPKYIRYGIGTGLNKKGIIRNFLNFVTKPKIALPLFIITLWSWHFPDAYNASLNNEFIHFSMHITMIISGLFFWWPITAAPPVRTSMTYPQKLLYLLIIITPTAALAAIITLSNTIIYTGYINSPAHFGISPFEDQRIGGLLMWIPGNLIYLISITIIFFKWFFSEEKKF